MTRSAILGLTLLAGLCTASLAHADDPKPTCEVPAYLLASDSTLSKVAAAIKGGKPLEAYSGKSTTSVTFSEPGDYVLHVSIGDYSGAGGGGSGCCWTNALIKVAVGGTTSTNGQ